MGLDLKPGLVAGYTVKTPTVQPVKIRVATGRFKPDVLYKLAIADISGS